jgi:peptidoglycan/LPS O-acetylase OafA/YrhL
MGYLLGQAFGKHVNVPLVDHQTSNRIIELLLLKHGIYFAIGVWLWHIRFHGGSPIKWSWLVLLVVAAFLDVWREVIHAREFYAQPIPIMGPLVAFAIAMVLMFYSIFKESAQRPWVSKVMRQIGLSTYPLYLVHTALGVSLMTVMLKHRFTPWLSVFSGLVLSIVGAVVIALLIEPTLQRVLRSILTPKAISSASYKGGSRQTRQNPR